MSPFSITVYWLLLTISLTSGAKRSLCEAAGSIELEATSNGKYTTKVALAAKVAGLYQHACNTARYLGSGNIFWLIIQ
jgi:hypothetical protein